MPPTFIRRLRFLLCLAGAGVLLACAQTGEPRRVETLAVYAPTAAPPTGLPAPIKPAAAPRSPDLPATPLPTLSPTRAPRPSAAPTATTNPFAVLTALAQTPTARPAAFSPPRRLAIPKLGLDLPTYPVGQDARGHLVVLDHDIAWWERSGKPGEGTNIALWAHVLRFQSAPHIPPPFAEIHTLAPGDRVILTAESGKQFNYAITTQVRARPDQTEYLLPTPLERIVLISCIGENIIVDGELTKTERLVTIAEPINVP
jgi:sortase (surface protein transpeptidase)